jgi:hypothetical protein
MTHAAPQLELFRPKADDPNVAWLAGHLFAKRDWQTAEDIVLAAGWYVDDKGNRKWRLNDRKIRALAESAAPKIISGQLGYKHTDHATQEEIKAFINTMRSQATRMLIRSNCVRKYAHAKIG